MRGHWESGTRKLNRHYQSGGKGSPSPIWRWGKYLTGGAAIPYRFEHDPDWDNEYQDSTLYYNKLGTSLGDVYGTLNPSADYTFCLPWEGPIADRYDGLVKPGQMVLTPGTDLFEWYSEEVLNRARPVRDPDAPSSSSAPGVHTNRLHLHIDLGKRFVRFHNPGWGIGPSYYYDGEVLSTLYNLGMSEYPIHTDIRIDAKACKMKSLIRGQKQEVTCRSVRPGGGYTNVSVFDSQDNVAGANIYDYEQNGQAYVESVRNNVLWDSANNVYKNVLFRVYTFIYDGDLYLDLIPHTLDPETLEPIPWVDPWYVAVSNFPSSLAGYCHMDPYVQPTVTGYAQYPSPMTGWGNVSATQRSMYYPPFTFDSNNQYQQVVLREGIGVNVPGKTPGVDATLKYLFFDNLSNTEMRIFDVAETDFWAAEAAWHQQHGGTPYDPLTGV